MRPSATRREGRAARCIAVAVGMVVTVGFVSHSAFTMLSCPSALRKSTESASMANPGRSNFGETSHLASATTTDSSPMPARLLGAILGFLVVVAGVSYNPSAAVAADVANGEATFLGVCAACHAGGQNSVKAEKALKKEALQKYGVYDINKIKAIVAGGQNTMPAFGQILTAGDLDDVATYVLQQADKGWPQ